MADETYRRCCTKRRRKFSNWSELHSDLLESILKRLSSVDVLRFKAVCSSWCLVAQAYISSSSYNTGFPSYNTGFLQTVPWLMLPPKEENDGDSCCFLNLEEKRVYELHDMSEGLGEVLCVGSSHGWVVHLDKKAGPYLLNPFSRARIQLPALKYNNGNVFDCDWYPSVTELPERFIAKVVLSSDPFHSNDYRVIVINGKKSKLAFCNCGDRTWTNLDGKHQSYSDIIFYNDQLYALADKGSVEVWDFCESSPVKRMDVEPSYPRKTVKVGQSNFRDVCSSNIYLVESSGDLLLVVRFIGDSVNANGQIVNYNDLLSDELLSDEICPYRTLLFDIYKLDFNQKKWIEVESLEDRVLFLGGNHSLSLSARDVTECKENSIYFTDDYWDRTNEDHLYGGHDLGVFNLEDKSIEPIYECNSEKIEPTPFWVVPNPW